MGKILLKKFLSCFVIASFLLQNFSAYGQLGPINTPFLNFNPATLRYLSVNSANPYNYFNFLLDKGDSQGLSPQGTVPADLNLEAKKLINYFFLGITLPDDDFWVNLRPDEPGRIISLTLAKTEMGRILLNQDLQLKKEAARLLRPDNPTGQVFWNKLYSEAENLLGKNKLKKTAIETSNRVWIVPDEATVMETDDGAFVVSSKLKVLLENDYLTSRKGLSPKGTVPDQLQTLSEQLMREIVIPEITKEVNQGESFAPLRQIYNSLILAQWFKRKHRNSQSIYSQAIGRGQTQGLESELPWEKQAIWQDYLKSYKQGEYNFKEKLFGLNRMYFSGGMDFTGTSSSAIIQVTKIIPFDPNIILGSSSLREGVPSITDDGLNAVITENKGTIGSEKIETIIDTHQVVASDKEVKIFASPIENKQTASSGIEKGKKEKDSLFEKGKNLLSSFVRGSEKNQEIPLGVQLEHFVWAQNRLAEQSLTGEELSNLLSKLGLNSKLTGDAAYNKIYEKLSGGNYTKELIDFINGNTYEDPRLSIEIIGQNSNPRSQGVLEAVANSLDALGTNIGQFGKGVKQIIDWLEATGEDRIDVFTLEENGIPYQLTIIKDAQEQNNISIRKISLKEFQNIAGQGINHGTVVRLTLQNKILRTAKDLALYRNSQEGLIESIHKRFPYVTSVRVTTQMGNEAPQKVNGFEEKAVIVPAETPSYSPADSEGKNIQVLFNDNTITVVDNGKGMDAQTLSRMFVPKQGSKRPESLSNAKAKEELKKVKVVQDKSLPHRVSFARNGEVVVAIDTPQNLQDGATAEGGLMVEFGSLMDVPESRDNIIIPLDLKPGETTNFELAINHAINQIINHPRLSNADKVKYINTIIVGLDGLVKGNENYAYVVKNIRSQTQKALAEIIKGLRGDGYIIFPHEKQFERLAIPVNKKVLFMHEKLFDWQGALSLKEIGAQIVPGITLGGEKRIPLVVVPFKEGSVKWILRFHRLWHTLLNEERLPVIKANRFVAISEELGKRLNELSQKRAKGLTKEEEKEFTSLLQRVNIITAEEVATSYEVTKPKENILIIPQKEFEKSEGEIDSEAINGFLTTPPVIAQKATGQMAPQQVPQDANLRYVRLEDDSILEVDTGNSIMDFKVDKLEYLRNGFYRIALNNIEDIISLSKGVVKYPFGSHADKELGHKLIITPDKRFAYIQYKDGKIFPFIFDLETGEQVYLGKSLANKEAEFPYIKQLQFTQDGKYLTYIEIEPGTGDNYFVVVEIREASMLQGSTKIGQEVLLSTRTGQEMMRTKLLQSKQGYEYSINPFANVAFLRDKDTGEMSGIDLETAGFIVTNMRMLHVDSIGTYTAIMQKDGNIGIYLIKSKKWLSAGNFGLKKIQSVFTGWNKNGKTFFGVSDEITPWDGKLFTVAADGSTIPLAAMPEGAYGESFFSLPDNTGIIQMFQREDFSLMSPTVPDSLQRLEKKGFYKHPNFYLFINNSNPEAPEAFDPVRGHRFPYKGEIIYWEPVGESLYYFYEGKTYYAHYYLDGEVRSVPFFKSAMDGMPAKFIVHQNVKGGTWKLNSLPFIRDLPIPSEYSTVSFDGKYFMFVNPKTGDVAYLDLKSPDKPVFVSTKPATTGNMLLDTKPADAPERFAIVQEEDGTHKLIELNDRGAPVLSTSKYKDIQRLNNDTFICYSDTKHFLIYKWKETGVLDVLLDNSSENTKEDKIITHSGGLVVLEHTYSGGVKYQYVFDVEKRKEYGLEHPIESKAAYLSVSGRFSVQETSSDQNALVYYDYKEEKPTARLIAMLELLQEYYVSDRADVVVIKYKNGKYGLFSLVLGNEILNNADHIEIDSSGKVAVVKKENGLSAFILADPHGSGAVNGMAEIRVTSDNQYIYLTSTTGPGSFIEGTWNKKYDIKTGEFLDLLAQTPAIRFWESYDLEKKTIWDSQTQGKPAALQKPIWTEISYQENSPTAPEKSLLLFGTTVLRYYKESDDVTKSADRINLETDDWWMRVIMNDQKLDSLQGGKVPYIVSKDGTIIGVKGLGKVSDYTFNKTYVNANKSFIVGQTARTGTNNTYCIDSEGVLTEITQHIPSGFVLTDINGDYFVFVNPKTQEIKYLDPRQLNKPVVTPSLKTAQQVPANAKQKYALLENGDVIEIGTEEKLFTDSFAKKIEALGGNRYFIETGSTQQIGEINDRGKHNPLLVALTGAKEKIVLSPDNKFGWIQNHDGQMKSNSILDLERTGKFYFLDNDFKMTPPASGDFVCSQLQFSADGKYLIYLRKNTTTGAQELVRVDLEKKEVVDVDTLILMGEEYELAINPFAPVAFLRNKTINNMALYDVETGVIMTRLKYLHTDASGLYTVMISASGEMSIYHHASKKVISTFPSGHPITNIRTLYKEDGTKQILMLDSAKVLESRNVYELNSSGELILINKDHFAEGVIEEFVSRQGYIFSSPDRLVKLAEQTFLESDPLQRLDKKGVYKHPKFDLIIDNSNPDNPKAIDPKNGNTYDYEGEIVKHESGYILYQKRDGYLIQKYPSGGGSGWSDLINTQGVEKEPNYNYRIGTKDGSYYVFNLWDFSGVVIIGKEGIKIKSSEYSLVSFDGTYYLFVNPKTGDAVYVDPKAPNQPIFVPASAQSAEPSAQAEEEQIKAIELWDKGVLSKRDAFIAQAQAVYKPFIALMPEENKERFSKEIEASLIRLYERQNEEIIKRYSDAIGGKELDLKTPLPFDIFEQKMQKIMQLLPAYLEKINQQLSQEEYNDEINVGYEYYANLFVSLFDLAKNWDVETGEINDSFFDVFAYGFGPRNQEQLDAAPLIARLIDNLKEASNYQIKTAEVMKIVGFLSDASRVSGVSIVAKQLKRIFSLRQSARIEFLKKLRKVFSGVSRQELNDYLDKPDSTHKLKEARPFIVFLSHDVEPLKSKTQFIPQGEDWILPEGGASISQVIKLEQRRPKTVKADNVMDMDYLKKNLNTLPKPSEALEQDIIKNTTVQRESGAYAAEITQNSKDATRGMKGELVVDFYLQKNAQGQEEYVEEAQDNGTGALQEVALLIPKSTKAEAGQIDLTGFFGTGKYTIFEGVDRVEIITKNNNRAYLFGFEVIKDSSGNTMVVKLTRVREVNDDKLKQGVTVRRIKAIDNTIPELDQMLAQRSWKTFAGLSQDESFAIYFIDQEGKKQPLSVEKEVLTEVDFKATKPGQREETNFGKMRIFSAKDMPLQIVDKAGLRVSEIKEEYLALIPDSLRRHHIEELGIIIQIPLPLIRNRSGFEHENEYLPTIQKYVAIEFYKAIAYKTLTQTKPQFVFEGFPLDWETNGNYWDSIDLNDRHLIDLAQKINDNSYKDITTEDLKDILPLSGVLDKEKKFLKVMLQLEVALPNETVSLAARRLAIQAETNKMMAEAQRKMLNIRPEKIPKISDIPFFTSKVRQATGILLAHQQMRHPEKYAVEPQTPEEVELLDSALHMSRNFGIKQVILMNDEVAFAGAFRGDKMYLSRSLARKMGQSNQESGFIDEGTDTIVHELGHFLEHLMRSDKIKLGEGEVYITELANFTHDAVGTFAEAMKYAAAVSLANHGQDSITASPLTSLPDASHDASLPTIEIPELTPNYYKKIEWERYLGQYVNVQYIKDNRKMSIPQQVISLALLDKDNGELVGHIQYFIDQIDQELRHDKDLREIGIWIIQGKNKMYVSKIFQGSGFSNITSKEALPPLNELIKEALRYEGEEDLNKLYLIHSHPGSGVPLFDTDIAAAAKMSEALEGDVTVMALPSRDKGKLIFLCDVKYQKNSVGSPLEEKTQFASSAIESMAIKDRLIVPIQRGSGWMRIVATPNEAYDFHKAYSSKVTGSYEIEFGGNKYVFPISVWEKMASWSEKTPDFERKGYFLARKISEGNYEILDFVPLGSLAADPDMAANTQNDKSLSQVSTANFELFGINNEMAKQLGFDLGLQNELGFLNVKGQRKDLISIPFHSHHLESPYTDAPSKADLLETKGMVQFLYSDKSKKGFLYDGETFQEVKKIGGAGLAPLKENSAPSSSAINKEQSLNEPGGIDLSKIELTLKDEKFVSSLNPADLKILRAGRALKQGWNSLSILYLHEIMLLLKDDIVNDIQNKALLQNILNQFKSKNLFDPQLSNFLHLLQLDQPIADIKLALIK